MKLDHKNTIVLQMALWGIPLSIAITLLKLTAWYITGFVSLLSDGLESIVSIVTATISYFTIKYAYLPADNNHPFGHQKAEYIAAVLEGLLIINVALVVFYEAWTHPVKMSSENISISGLLVSLIASAVNMFWGRFLIRIGERNHSPALKANGKHLVSDVMMSISVVSGLFLVIITKYTAADSILAVLIACNILYQGWKIISFSLGGLMDSAVTLENLEKIKNVIALNASGSIGVHDLKIRQAGATFFVNFHLVVDSKMTVVNAHKICDTLEKSIENSVPKAFVTIHVEPESENPHGINIKL
ncbi:cation diffusion facilitator family transporter [Candidatus Liberibacter sp.]|uniref:cation diffusion facilitator family transporter n=1 Tax=Candidatus Liberibacter sp. TaxID=34022 RepID=UPI0015F48767|nr:cation diffusion facilitator family transporter [Candidatus Liberibacter sp.]MBA5723591.1 cation transporter [Candidatus Liberibacter sp.]